MNPADINIEYTLGDTAFSSTFADFEAWKTRNTQFAIVNGVALACGIILMVVSWIIIVNKRAPIFAMNQTMLVIMVIKSAMYLKHIMGPLNSLTFRFTGLMEESWAPYNVYVTINVLHVLLVAAVESSLVFQIHVVFKLSRARVAGRAIVLVMSTLALLIVSLYLYSTVRHAQTLRAELSHGDTTTVEPWVDNVPLILFSASLNVLCLLLALKLVFAVRTRRHLGLRQFDSFHILIIMATQTFVIPSSLVIANYRYASLPLLSSISIIVAVCNLPLCSLWACSNNNSLYPTSSQNTILSRYETETSQATDASLTTCAGIAEKGFDKSPDSPTFGDQDSVSISHILDSLEKDVEGVTTHRLT